MSIRHKFQQLLAAFGPYKNKALLLVLVILLSAGLEAFGFALLLPLLDTIVNVNSGTVWSRLIAEHYLSLAPKEYALLMICCLFVGVILIKNIFLLAKTAFAIWFAQGVRRYWAITALESILKAPYAYVIDQKQGLLINNVVLEPSNANKALYAIAEYISKVALALALYGVLLIAHWKMTLGVSLLAMGILFMTRQVIDRYSTSFGNRRVKLSQELNSTAAESFSGIRQIKAFNLEEIFKEKFSDQVTRLVSHIIKYRIVSDLPARASELFLASSLVGILAYLYYVARFDLKEAVPLIGLFAMVSNRLTQTVSVLISQRMRIFSNLPALKVLRETAQVSPERALGNFQVVSSLEKGVEFEGVNFFYKDGSPVLHDFNFKIQVGKMTAVIGPSGSGKSTVADLILGLHTPQKGRVLVDGKDLRELDLPSWRGCVGFVSQDVFVFNTTIRQNILFGRPEASNAQVEEVAKMAHAHDFIQSMPEGYDTVVGDRGLKLSGGQRQRISLARALIRNPDFFIFDEATSALDNETEKLIQDSIHSLAGKNTILVIAHRLSTIEGADQVCELAQKNSIKSS